MRSILLILGYILLISALFRAIPVAVALIYGEPLSMFIFTFLVSALAGIFFILVARGREQLLVGPEDALLIAAISFIIIPLIGSISFLPDLGYVDAVFESVSGFTTTGLSVYPSLVGVNKSVIMWRALIQWMGGLGIIAIFLFIFYHFPVHSIYAEQQRVSAGKSLYAASGYPRGMGTSISSATKRILILYTGMTLFGILIMALSGMELFDSLGITFTSLSTGGFVLSDSFDYKGIQLISISLMMLLGSLPFNMYAMLLWERSVSRNSEILFFFAIILALFSMGYLFSQNFFISLFHLFSAVTTTGFALQTIEHHPVIFFLLFVAMFMGGCTASTAGGVKQVRIILMLKSILWALRRIAQPPSQVISLKYEGRIIEEKDLLLVQIFIILSVITLFAGSFVLVYLGYDLLDSIFLSMSALGTVGLSTVPVYNIPALGKIVLIFIMLLGRLEIFPVLLLFRSIFSRVY
ncbi:MAG: TrkH family potassium uptake protein [Archaeoglobaceae archaeon]